MTVWQRECLGKMDTSNGKSEPITISPSKSRALRIAGPLSQTDSAFAGFFAEACRACTGRFVFRTREFAATILTGIPTDVKYKAVSYVWGEVKNLGIYCRCGERKDIPMAGPDRFSTLLSLAATKNDCDGVWLDALSIDQDSHSDKQIQIAAMGQIYDRAETVLVLLPAADQDCFTNLRVMMNAALEQDGMGLLDFEKITWDTFNASHQTVVEFFLASFEDHKRGVHSSTYFRRAWTFQEWALAKDVDVACENRQSDEGAMALLPNVKTCVIRAAVRLSMHLKTFQSMASAAVKCRMKVADVPAFVEDLMGLFPQEDVFCSSEEVDWNEVFVDNIFPFTGMHNQLRLRLAGTRNFPHPPSYANSYQARSALQNNDSVLGCI